MRNLVCGWAMAVIVAGAQAQPAWPGAAWERATPESQGMDSRALAELVAFGAAEQMDSVLVVRDGRIVLETYYAPFAGGMLHALNSATKAVMGTVTGIAIAQGALPGADTPVTQVLPARLAAAAQGKERITLQHLLDMTSGLDWSELLTDAVPHTMLQMARSGDWPAFVLQRPMAQPPGAGFNYNSGNSQLLSEILQERSGLSAEAFAARHLFGPLGIREWRWRTDPARRSTGGWGLYLAPPDMARYGLLYLRGGEWQGRQVVPRTWVAKVFAAAVPMVPAPGPAWRYADGWWTRPDRDAFMAVGMHRQMVIVMPRARVVAVVTGRRHYDIDLLLDRIHRAVRSDAALPANEEATAELARALAGAAAEPLGATSPVPALAQSVSGRRWAVSGNPLGVRELVLRFGEAPVMELMTSAGEQGGRQLRFPLGLAGRYEAGGPSQAPVLTRSRWVDERTFALEQRHVQDGHTVRIQMRFDGDEVQIDYVHPLAGASRFTARPVP